MKSLLVAKAALENARRFVQQNGSEDDANLNHDALYHVDHCISKLGDDGQIHGSPLTALTPVESRVSK